MGGHGGANARMRAWMTDLNLHLNARGGENAKEGTNTHKIGGKDREGHQLQLYTESLEVCGSSALSRVHRKGKKKDRLDSPWVNELENGCAYFLEWSPAGEKKGLRKEKLLFQHL